MQKRTASAMNPSDHAGQEVRQDLKWGPESRVRVSGSTYARPFGDELVLLDFGRGEYFALDAIGAVIWRGLERGEPLGAIAAEVAAGYEVTAEAALGDIIALVGEMQQRALVSVDPNPISGRSGAIE
jgi:hypothetical protein